MGNFNAEARMDAILNRLDQFSGSEAPASSNSAQADAKLASFQQQGQNLPAGVQDTQSFAAMVSLMQHQMLGEALTSGNKDDDQNSNPMMSMMGGGANPMMSSMMGGMSNSSFANSPALTQLMSQQQGGMPGMQMGMPAMGMMQQQQNPMMSLLGMANQMGNNLETGKVAIPPIKGAQISSDFGHRHHPIDGHHHFHSGVDLAAPQGTPIRMPWDGEVVYVGEVNGFGPNTVVVAHHGQRQADGKILYSVFGHNEHAFVKTGEYIKAGDIFATVGSEGRSTGSHLHWETRAASPGVAGQDIFQDNISIALDPKRFMA